MQQSGTSLKSLSKKLVLKCRVSAVVCFPNCCFQIRLELWRPFKWIVSAYWACQVAWMYLFKCQQDVSCMLLLISRFSNALKSQCCKITETALQHAGPDGPKYIYCVSENNYKPILSLSFVLPSHGVISSCVCLEKDVRGFIKQLEESYKVIYPEPLFS